MCAVILFRAWFWLSEPTDNGTSIFNLKRDSIYGAVILLGIGNGLSWVISGSMGVDLIGKFTVSGLHHVYLSNPFGLPALYAQGHIHNYVDMLAGTKLSSGTYTLITCNVTLFHDVTQRAKFLFRCLTL